MTEIIFNNPILDTLSALDDSLAMRAIRAIEDPPSIRIMRDIENSPALKVIKNFEESPAFKAIRQIQDSPGLRAIQALDNSPFIEAFSKVADQLTHNYGALNFSEAYELLVDEYDELSGIEKHGSWDSLSEKVQDRASHSPFSPLSAEFYLSLIFALFFFYLSQMSATESEERLLKKMNGLEQTITTQLKVLRENDSGQVFLVTDRALNLRAGPKCRSISYRGSSMESKSDGAREKPRLAKN